jgi:steroid 5-alpha reductase family enzyme
MWVELNMKIINNLLISLLAFVIAISIAVATGIELVFNAVFLAFAIQWIAFIPAYIFQTEKFYDLTGSLTYLSVIWYSLVLSSDQFTNINGANIAIVLLISLWAIRLGSFLFMRIHHDGEDKRFRSIKPSASQFFMTWTLQGLWVSLCSMCALTAISSNTGVVTNVFFYIGLALFITGFTVEVVADMQKSAFKAIPANKDKFITLGLWAKSRHPNYLGEIVLWTGIAVMSFSSLQGLQYLTLISPIFTYLLLVYVSGVRMLEARGDIKWGDDPDYQNYKKSTPTLFFKFF